MAGRPSPERGGGHLDDAAAVACFYRELWDVLARQVALFTMGESSSVAEYDAYRLLASACFTLGVDADELAVAASASEGAAGAAAPVASASAATASASAAAAPTGEAAATATPAVVATVRALLGEGVGQAFARRQRQLEDEARRIDELWRQVCLAIPLVESVALKDTLNSLRGFPQRYDARFFAHEIPADIDYPLCQPVPETTLGVAYVREYLERLLAESSFLQCFDVAACRSVLHAVHPGYGELILNLFEPIAANALGCALAGCSVHALRIDDAARARIAATFEGRSSKQAKALLVKAAVTVGEALAKQAHEQAHEQACWPPLLEAFAASLQPRIATALRTGGLAGIFVSPSDG